LLEKILSFIDETDSHTMHSCILANRIWCKTMMPKLWRNPFHLVALRPSEKLIPVYFKFLSNETKLILQVPLSSIKSSSLQLRSLPAIFDYPKFLRELDFNELYLAIRKWCFSNLNTLSSTNQRGRQSIFILQELCSLLMRNCDRLDLLSLDIKSLRSNNSDGGMSDHIALPCLVGASNCLSSLKTFISRGYYEKQLVFKSMTQYCKNIREIIVEDNDSTDGDSLIDLIIIQNHLEKFVIGDWWGNLSKIFQSLKTQFESLIYVEIHGCHFYEYVDDFRTFEGLVFCQNLETLKIEECYNLT
ncbi:23209_t:CDS:1, partial [Gigaspora rosea]